MEKILTIASLFIFNITIILRKTSEVIEEINYVLFEVEVINTKRDVKMFHKMLINTAFIENNKLKNITNYNILEKLLIEYVYTKDRYFRDKFEKVFNKDELLLLFENTTPFSNIDYIDRLLD